MSVSLSQHGGAYYVSGVGTLPDLCWYRDGDQWLSRPEARPSGAESVEATQLPHDLREELLAFIARAEVMGPSRWDSGN